jgi:hypothetical protein
MIELMTETPESRTTLDPVAGTPSTTERPYTDDRYSRPNRLSQALAWVGIVAGVVFVVAVVFFSGFFIGRSSGGHYGGHRGHYQCGQMSPGQMMGPGMIGPGQMGPGQLGPGMGPNPSPPTSAPGMPRR